MNYMQLLNVKGDITIVYDDDQREMMKEIVEKKLKEGYAFFIEEGDREIRIKNVSQMDLVRHIIIGDKDAEELLRNGKIGIAEVIRSNNDEIITRRRASSANEVVNNNTIVVQPKKGG